MKIFILLLFQLTILFAAAQQSTIDSLKTSLPGAKQDTNQVILLAALSNQYLYSRPDSAVLVAQQGYGLARQLNFPKGEALCLNRMANANINMGNSSKALEFLQKAKVISEKINDKTGVARALNNIANIYIEQNQYATALQYMLEAKKFIPYVPDQSYSTIVAENLGDIYYHLNSLDSAWMYIQQSYELARKYNVVFFLGDILRIHGDIQAKKGNQTLALAYYRQSQVYSGGVSDNQHLSQSCLSMAKLYQEAGQRDSSIFYAKKALERAQVGAFTADILNAAGLLSEVFEKGAQHEAAFHYYKIATAAKDSLFSQEKVKQMLTLSFDEKMKQQEIENANNSYQDKIKIYILLGGLAVLLLAAIILIRNNRQKQKAYALLQKQKKETDLQKSKAEQALENLKATQMQLIQSEKMASLGELTAGIAHEIQNPLNFINNFSEVNTELIEELEQEIEGGNMEEVKAIANDIKENEQKINQHGRRADAIVKGMLQHSRSSTGQKEPTDINALADEYLRLSYHGLRAKDKSFNAAIETHLDESIGKIEVVPQDIGRVLLNLFNNAFYSVAEKKRKLGEDYGPTVSVSTKRENDKIMIVVRDNGFGIPQKVADKIFQPFFTTKPTGEGTGLGLSLSYDIIKAHGGELKVNSIEGERSRFSIELPA